jgi:tungstate transport system substrate-binding protein
MKRLFCAMAAALAAVAGCTARPATLRIATTTSVESSGLLETLVPAFQKEHGVTLQAIAVGSGQAFQLGRRGDVALLLTHEPAGERALFNEGLVRYYRKLMFNRFVIAGPVGDPAGAAGAASASDAMARIARGSAPFVSRGDESGTHVRERQLWKSAGIQPQPARLIETGQGMAPTLRVAAERQGYVLTDEATLARLANAVNLRVIYQDGPDLLNTYAIVILTTAPADSRGAAETFARWMTEGAGRDVIDRFRIGGRQVFFGWPAGGDNASPESMPAAVRGR